MLGPVRKTSAILGKAFVSTVFCAGIFHLTVIVVRTIATRNVGYLNPIDFLGLGSTFPSLRHSLAVTLWAWGLLVLLFGVLVYATIHYKRYLGIVQQSLRRSRAGRRPTSNDT